MGDRLKEIKLKSQKRRELVAKQLGLSSIEGLRGALSGKDEQKEGTPGASSSQQDSFPKKRRMSQEEQANLAARQEDPYEEKEEVYTDSSAFLKGTQSENPHNDYCQNFVDTGERPQNYIRDVGLANRFEEYPKLRELIRLKDELIQTTNTPPMYLKCDLETFDLRDLDCKFDVILLEPPLEEYQRAQGMVFDKYWDWDEIEQLEIDHVAAPRSFIWIWVGAGEGLDRGRRCLKKWGYRRCEDICWIKTNLKNPGHNKNLAPKAVLERTKEHCLMGIKGTVRRSMDGDFIHANVDIDLIIDEEPEYGSKEKPIEIYHIIEHFCLGRRRLHIFGRDTTIRPGWVTIGPELTSSNFDPEQYRNFFNKEPTGHLTGCSEEVERLRPKSPPPKNNSSERGSRGGQGGRGRGGQRGGANSGGQQGRGGGMNRGGRGGPGGRGGMRGGPGGWRGDRGRGHMRGGYMGRGGHRDSPMMH